MIVPFEPPAFVICTVCVDVVEVVTEPKLTLVGVALNVAGETPDPLRATLRFEFEALLLILRLPLVVPVELGLNETLTDVLCPGLR